MSKLFVLALAAVALMACGTTERAEVAAFETQSAREAPKPRIVVRGKVVPDEPETAGNLSTTERALRPAAKRPSTVAAVKPVNTAALAAKTSAAVGAVAAATAEALAASPATPAPAPAPVVETALPTTTADGGVPTKPNTMSTDIPAMIQSLVGGIPLWILALVGVVLFAAVALGFSGGKKTGEA